jgi:hypothetical protein
MTVCIFQKASSTSNALQSFVCAYTDIHTYIQKYFLCPFQWASSTEDALQIFIHAYTHTFVYITLSMPSFYGLLVLQMPFKVSYVHIQTYIHTYRNIFYVIFQWASGTANGLQFFIHAYMYTLIYIPLSMSSFYGLLVLRMALKASYIHTCTHILQRNRIIRTYLIFFSSRRSSSHIHAYKQEYVLALLMGTHARLGANSPVFMLNHQITWNISEIVKAQRW